MAIDLGSHPLVDLRLGTTEIVQVNLGATNIWTNPAVINERFNLLGFLWTWINQFISDAEAGISGDISAIISDGLGGVLNGLGNLQGTVAKFLPTINLSSGNPGVIVSQLPSAVVSSICDDLNMIGGFITGTSQDGVLGLLNGLPVVGGAFSWLEQFFGALTGPNPLTGVLHLVGAIPVVGDLQQLTGVLGDVATGIASDPVNFVTDLVGNVIGQLSCGNFTPTPSGVAGTPVNIHYPIGVVGGMARMLVPDGLVSLSTQTSTLRHQTILGADNGWVQAQVSTLGDSGYVTQIFRRFTNDGTAGTTTSGVGIDLRDSFASIVRRVGGTDVLVAPGVASFTPGDVIRLDQTGNSHQLSINGAAAGAPWVDSGATAAVGSAYRSVAMTMNAAQDLSGPRRFSPSLAWLQAA